MTTKIAIVGGGLSGLTTAFELSKRGLDFQLFEARERFGGRILALDSTRSTARFDLGPSWFWPGQTHIENLVKELGLTSLIYTQYSVGDAVYEPDGGPLQRGISGVSMAGSYRLRGGLTALIDALVKSITELGFGDCLQLSSAVSKISQLPEHLVVAHPAGEVVCHQAILALPARLVLANIELIPKPSSERTRELQSVATWMAGHAKVVAEYDTPFWRRAGFSGDAISQIGPMSEIHDASSALNDEEPQAFALFGFLGMSTATRQQQTAILADSLSDSIIAQLVRIFGEEAKTPANLVIQDWALEPFTASIHDQNIANQHQINQWSTVIEPGWKGCLVWSGSETVSDHSNGYLEGAVLASRQAIKHLMEILSSKK